MPLTRLECHQTGVSDLSPLKGMPRNSSPRRRGLRT